jgi:hypothetical protein
MPPSSRVSRPVNRGADAACGRSSVALSNFRRSRPSDGRSIANDLATNTSGGVQAEAEGGLRAAVVALAGCCTAGVRPVAMAPTGDHLTSELRRVLKEAKGRPIHHRPDKP